MVRACCSKAGARQVRVVDRELLSFSGPTRHFRARRAIGHRCPARRRVRPRSRTSHADVSFGRVSRAVASSEHRGPRQAEWARHFPLPALCGCGGRSFAAIGGTRMAPQRRGTPRRRVMSSSDRDHIQLYVRLLFATALFLHRVRLSARALGIRSVSATLAWSLTLVFGALGVSLRSDPLSLSRSHCSLPRASQRRSSGTSEGTCQRAVSWRWAAASAGGALGIVLWSVAGSVEERPLPSRAEHGGSSSSTSSR